MTADSENRGRIAGLGRIIRAEECKPEDERSAGLIDECIREIAGLKGVGAGFSDEEIKEITDRLVRTEEQERRRKRFIRFGAGMAAALLLITGITACLYTDCRRKFSR